jgi:hypothetical protein
MSAGVASWARPEDVPLRPRIGAPLAAGAFLLIAFFAGFGGWAALAPLSSATVAEGVIRVETHRKTVQHLEGGIVREILVNEGDKVTAMIINVDRKNRSINLSVKAKDAAEETEAMKQLRTENAASAAGSTNLGALLRAKLDKDKGGSDPQK